MENKIAFLFPGQGAQFVGMGTDFFRGKSGGIYDVMRDGPMEELNKTKFAQEAIFLHSLAAAEALSGRGVVPDCVAGFSLGEITALHFTESLDCTELLKVRAEAMQKCCETNPGMMVAVLRLNRVVEFDKTWAVNFNSPDQIVYSCCAPVVDEFIAEVVKQGGRAVQLKVSGAFHSPLMNTASGALREFLVSKSLGNPSVPVYSNVTAGILDKKELISEQVKSPVLWRQTVENMLDDGVRTFIEVGPGQVLAGLVKKIVDDKGAEGVRVFSVGDIAGADKVAAEVAK